MQLAFPETRASIGSYRLRTEGSQIWPYSIEYVKKCKMDNFSVAMNSNLDEAINATTESANVEFKQTFELSSTQDWVEIIKDIVAVANSGGGTLLFGVDNFGQPTDESVEAILRLDPADITNKVKKYTNYEFVEFALVEALKGDTTIAALQIFALSTPLVFTKPGTYPTHDNKQRTAFGLGTIYFRHGAKSEPGTYEDLREFVGREVAKVRDEWLDNIRKVVEAPTGSQVFLIKPDSTDEGSPGEVPIRVVDDPSAPAFQRLDRDNTHPYRQTEVIKELNRRLKESASINQHDIKCIRAVHSVDQKPQFYDQPKYGSPQYSDAFVEWIVEESSKDPDFFARTRSEYRGTQLR